MSKTVEFDLKYKDAIESGEAVVTTRNGNSVDIIDWEWSEDFPLLVKDHNYLCKPRLYTKCGKIREFYQNYTVPKDTDLVVTFKESDEEAPKSVRLDVGLVLWTDAIIHDDELASPSHPLGYQKLNEKIKLTWGYDFLNENKSAIKDYNKAVKDYNKVVNASCYFKSYTEELEDWAQLDLVMLRQNVKADSVFFTRRHGDAEYFMSPYLFVRNESGDIVLTQRIILE